MKSFFEFKKLIKRILTCTSHVLLALLFFFIAPQYPASDIVQQKHELTHQHTEEEEHDHEEEDHVHAEQIRLEQTPSNKENTINNINNDYGIQLMDFDLDDPDVFYLDADIGVYFSSICPISGKEHIPYEGYDLYEADGDISEEFGFNAEYHWQICLNCHLGMKDSKKPHMINPNYQSMDKKNSCGCGAETSKQVSDEQTFIAENETDGCSMHDGSTSFTWESLESSLSDDETATQFHVAFCDKCGAALDFHTPVWKNQGDDYEFSDSGHKCTYTIDNYGDCPFGDIEHTTKLDEYGNPVNWHYYDSSSSDPIEQNEKNKEYHWLICDDCGAAYGAETHEFSEWTTEEIDGENYHSRTCEVCGYKESHSAPNDETNTDTSWKQFDGYHQCYDENCTITAPHTFDDWDGTEDLHTRTCSVCGYVEECGISVYEELTFTVFGTGHQCNQCKEWVSSEHSFEYGDKTHTNTKHWQECIYCGAKEESEDHSFSWVLEGSQHKYKCSICGYVDESKTHNEGVKWQTSSSTTTSGWYTNSDNQHQRDCDYSSGDTKCTLSQTHPANWKSGQTFGTWYVDAEGKHCRDCADCDIIDSHPAKWGQINTGGVVDSNNHKCTETGCTVTASHNYTDVEWKSETRGGTTYHYRECNDCGYRDEHTPDFSSSTANKDSDANQKHQCNHEGCTVKVDHKFSPWEGNEALHTRTCSDCGYVDECGTSIFLSGVTFTVSGSGHKCEKCNGWVSSGHEFDKSYMTNETNHWYKCKYCEAQDSNGKHIFDWVLEDGQHKHKCSTCGYVNEYHNENANWGDWYVDTDGTTHKRDCNESDCDLTQSHILNEWVPITGGELQQTHHKCSVEGCTIVETHGGADGSKKSYKEGNTGHHIVHCDICGEEHREAHVTTEHSELSHTNDSKKHSILCDLCKKQAGNQVYHDGVIWNDCEHHSIKCSCGYEMNNLNHVDEVTKVEHDGSIEYEKGSDGLCDVCGGSMTGHDYQWIEQDGQHIHQCKICKVIETKTEHVAPSKWQQKDASYHICGVNGCDITDSHTLENVYDASGHYQKCTKCDYKTEPTAHSWEEGWTSDGTSHWHKCADPNCHEKYEEAPHNYNKWKVVGSNHEHQCICGAVEAETIHAAPKDGEWKSNGTENHICGVNGCDITESHKELVPEYKSDGHYQKCPSCDYEIKIEDHTWDEKNWTAGEAGHWHKCTDSKCSFTSEVIPHTYKENKYDSTAEGHRRICDECGYPENIAFEGHDYEWKEEGIEHVKICQICGYKDESSRHTPSGWTSEGATNAGHKCSHDNCTILQEHTFDKWVSDGGSGHHEECSVCGYHSGNTGTHDIIWTPEGNEHKGKCTSCDYETSHTPSTWTKEGAKDGYHKCIECGLEELHKWESTWSHNDTNHYHKCEKCDAQNDVTSHSYTKWTKEDTLEGTIHKSTCDDCNHETSHPAPTTWKEILGDDNNHQCSVEGCTIKEAHNYSWDEQGDEHVGTCSCGHEIRHAPNWTSVGATEGKHKCTNDIRCTIEKDHTFDKWVSDNENEHHEVCSACGISSGKTGNHTLTWDIVGGKHQGSCTSCDYETSHDPSTWTKEGAKDGFHKCTKDERCTIEEEHTFEITWSFDDNNHYHKCEKCDAQNDVTEHVLEWTDEGSKHTAKCTQDGCGFTDEHPESTWKEIKGDDDNHQCSVEGCTIKEAHSYSWDDQGDEHVGTCSCTHSISHESTSTSWTSVGATNGKHKCANDESCTIEKTHIFDKWVSKGASEHQEVCSACGYEGKTETHVLTWETVDGNHQGSCTSCEYTTSHVPSTWTSEGAKDGYHKCTGADNSCTIEEAHTWGAYEVKGEKHVRTCTAEGCNATQEHTPNWGTVDDTNHKCLEPECGIIAPHESDGLGEHNGWYADVNCHYLKCKICGASYNRVFHTYGEWTTTPGGQHTSTCIVCGFDGTHDAQFVSKNGEKHKCNYIGCTFEESHTNSDGWHSDENGHYYICEVCHVEYGRAVHTDFSAWQKNDVAHWHECTDCGYKGEYELHNFIQLKGEEAKTKHQCEFCGQEAEHTFGQWESVDSDGTIMHQSICSVCGYTNEHEAKWTYVDEKSHKCSDCTITEGHDNPDKWYDDGTNHYHKCSKCGESYGSAAHEYHKGLYEKDNDRHWKVCDICGYKEQGDGTLHHAAHWIADNATNKHYQICEECGQKFNESEHSFNTYIQNGSQGHYGVCEQCKITSKLENHNYDSWNEHSRTCQTCKYVDSHNPKWEQKETDDIANHVCSICGAEGAHTFDKWLINGDTTTHHVECSECGYAKGPEGHNFQWSLYNNEHYGQCKECGYTIHHPANWVDSEDGEHHKCTVDGCTLTEEHQWGAWTKVGENHERTCTVAGCEAKQSHGIHWVSSGNTSHHCDGKDCTIVEGHDGSDKWVSDGEYHYHVCSVCGAEYDKVKHSHEINNKYGYDGEHHWYLCDVCNEKIDSTEARHSMTNSYDEHNHYEICSACGYKTNETPHELKYQHNNEQHWQKCTGCEYEINRANHDEVEWSTSGELHWKECATCGAKDILSGNHQWGAWSISEDNLKHERTCTVCGATQSHDIHWVSSGNTSHYCDGKDCTIVEGHDGSSEWKEKTEDGALKHYHECSVCKAQYDVGEHSYPKEVYSSDKNGHWQVCEVCGKETEHVEHSYKGTLNEGWSYNAETGKHERTCEACKYSESHLPNWGELGGDDEHHQCKDCVLTENHTYKWISDGTELHHEECSVCGHQKETHESHTLTYTEVNGKHIGTCKCGYQDEGHDPVWEDNKNGNHECQVCHMEVAHTFDESTWKYDDTHHYHVCTVCGAEEVATGNEHVIKWQVVDGKHVGTCTEEGCEYRTTPHEAKWTSEGATSGYHKCSELGCDIEEEHQWGAWAKSGDKGHTRSCLVSGCTAEETHDGTKGYTNLGNGKHQCKEDGCTYEEDHVKGEIQHDGEHHWYNCTICDAEELEQAGHTPDTVENSGWHTDKEYHYRVCSVCGEEYDKSVGHTWGTWYKTEDNKHEVACTLCGATKSHNITTYKDLKNGTHQCNEVGCEYIEDHIKGAIQSDESHHWYNCTVCGATNLDLAAHTQDTTENNGWHTDDPNGHYYQCATCGEHYGQQKHQFNSKYDHDENHHWLVCDICGAKQTGVAEQEHSSDVWISDGKNHYKICVCGQKIEEGVHDSKDQPYITTEEEHYKVCKVCGLVDGSTREYHDYGDGTPWFHDNTSHYHYCATCGYRSDVTEHSSIDGAWIDDVEKGQHYQVCQICGARFNYGEHSYGDTWISDGLEGHHQKCSLCGHDNEKTSHSSSTWQHDEHNHYQLCDKCGQKFNESVHTYNAEGYTINERTGAHERTCTQVGCGYVDSHFASFKEDIGKNTHTCQYEDCNIYEEHSSESYIIDGADGHHKVCDVCGARFNDGAHNFGDTFIQEKDPSLGHHQRCSVCGYETPTEGHNFETPYTKESDKALGHYYKCKDCGYETERVNHNFGDTYYQDGENNKHYQICEDCEYRTPSEEHRNHYESNDKGHWLVCDVCGKSTRDEGGEDKGILSHEAKTKGDGSLEYYDDGTNHWLVCKDCGAVFNKEAHTPKVGWQSNESEHYQVCSICGFIIESSRETHSYELDKWVSTDKTYHWQECTKCGYKHNYGVHNFVPEGHDDDGYIQRCEDCGYVTHHEAHIGEWKVNAEGTKHERKCIICGFIEEHLIKDTTWSPVDDGMHKCDQCTITASHEGADLTTWFNSEDGSYHYHKCDKCGEFDKGNHTYEKGIYESNLGEDTHSPVCDVCGMKKQGESSEHESSEWIVDNELHQHYKKCDKCGAEFERNDHTPDKGESGLTNNYYATEENHYHICEVCGATYGSKAHNYEGVEWSKDGTNHWKVCKECGYKGELSGHSLEWKETEDQTKHYQECSICGYKTEEVEHTSDGYIMDLVKNQHYKVCKECGIEFARGSHTYDDTWKYNDETHWKECTVCQYKDQLRSHSATEYVISGEEHHQVCSCGKEINRSEHHYNTYQYEENGEVHWKVCDECGHKETGSETSHHSSRGYDLDETGNYHYQVCDDCHAQFNKGEHQFSNKYIEYGEFHYQVCDVCNRAIESTKEEHSYKLDWQVEENIHFHACVKCGHRIDIGSHSSSSWKDAGDGHHYQVCEFCGTRFNENQEHVFNGKYDHDTHDHWEVCDLCGAEKAGSRTSHNYTSTYDSENHYEICDTCGDIINKSAHSFEKHFNNEEHWWSCSCGYEKDRASHDEVSWSSDGTYHWKECKTCEEKYSNEAHTYGEWQDDLNPEAPHEHTRECEICHTEASRQCHKENYVDSGDGLTHVCSYVGCNIKQGHDGSSTWLSDKEGNHYHECSICGAHYDVEKHSYPKDVYSSDKDGHYQVCEVCGKESTHVEHDSFTSWTINTETGIHYRTCTTCGYNDAHIAQWENDVAVAKHKCTVSGCNIVENHDLIWVNDEELGHHQECSVCDYETSISNEHHFIWATVNGEHYGQCECGYIIHHAPIWQNKDHEHHICEVCGLEESHQWGLWEVDGNHHVRTCLVDGCEATDSHEIHWERVDDASHRCIGKDCTIVEGHDNSITFEFDDTYHYHVCSKCGEYDKEAHVFKDTYKYDNTHHYKICEVCGYASKEKEAHSSKDLIYHIDGNKHYQVCDICGARFNEGEHIFTSIYGHDENGHYLLCEVCGMASETKLNHTYGEWLKEDNKHIHLCTTCGYIEEHEASYESNENEHYCVVDGCTIHEEHDFENNTCKVCNYQRRGISLGNDLSIPISILGLQIILLGILIIMVIRRKDEGGDEE